MSRVTELSIIANEGDFVVQDFGNLEVYKRPFAYLSVGINGVASNYFLTGTTPYGSSNIKPLPFFGVAQLGVSLPLHVWFNGKRAYWPRLVYAINLPSPEFETLGGPSTAAVQRWGSITLNWDFD